MRYKEKLKGMVGVWVVPKRVWSLEVGQFAETHMELELHTGTLYQDGAVRVCEEEVVINVEVDSEAFTRLAIRTLEDQITEKRADHHKWLVEMRDKIQRLQRLEYIPQEPSDAT